MKKGRYAKEWNIVAKSHDGIGGFDETFIVLHSWLKVVAWFFLNGRKYFEIDIWTTRRASDG